VTGRCEDDARDVHCRLGGRVNTLAAIDGSKDDAKDVKSTWNRERRLEQWQEDVKMMPGVLNLLGTESEDLSNDR
jgi:hypothetical protein